MAPCRRCSRSISSAHICQNSFAILSPSSQSPPVQEPLAVVFYDRLMPGSQLVNRLQDLNYRVFTVGNIALLAATIRREQPLLVVADLAARGDVCATIGKIMADPVTNHLSLIAFSADAPPGPLWAPPNTPLPISFG